MKNKQNIYTGLLCLLVLSACGGGVGFIGTPKLKAGEAIIWHYNCEGGNGLDVEYAQMGGSYSATLSVPENGKKVLTQDDNHVFRLDDWRWQTDDSQHYRLFQKENIVLNNCIAMHEASVDDLRGVHKGIFSDKD